MEFVKIKRSSLHGKIKMPSSKSAAHRALICSFLLGGGEVIGIDSSNDIEATKNALASLKNGESVID